MDDSLEEVCAALRSATGCDFLAYDKNALSRCVERRMRRRKIRAFGSYAAYIKNRSSEGDLLANDLLAGVTRFFRDPVAWEHFRGECLPRLFARRRPGATLRAWVAGCSPGEDDYSLAIAFKESVSNFQPRTKLQLQVFATHVDRARALGDMLLVLIEDGAAASPSRTGAPSVEMTKVERELERSRDDARTMRQEMQTSEEELRCTNEALQSTNEELIALRAETHALNEELQSCNDVLRLEVESLSRRNDDLHTLLNGTEGATLHLDSELRIRGYTPAIADLVRLIPADAGRMITDLTNDLDYPDLADDAREVLRAHVPRETHVGAKGGRWFRVRISPQKTMKGLVEGVIVTFSDATAHRTLEISLRREADALRHVVERTAADCAVLRAELGNLRVTAPP